MGRILAALLLGAVLLAPSRAEEEEEPPGPVYLRKGKITFRPEKGVRHRHSLKFTGKIGSERMTSPFDPTRDGVEMRIGTILVCAIDPGAEKPRWRSKRGDRWSIRTKDAFTGAGKLSLRFNFVSGKYKVKASKVDLSAVKAAGPEGVPVFFRFGEVNLSGAFDFTEKGIRWTFKAPKKDWIPELPPDWPEMGKHELGRLEGYATTWPEGLSGPHHVLRSQGDLQAFSKYIVHTGGMATASVNFDVYMVVVIFADCAYKLELPDFEIEDDTLVVRYGAYRYPSYCVSDDYPTAFNGSHIFVAVYQFEGPVRFERIEK